MLNKVLKDVHDNHILLLQDATLVPSITDFEGVLGQTFLARGVMTDRRRCLVYWFVPEGEKFDYHKHFNHVSIQDVFLPAFTLVVRNSLIFPLQAENETDAREAAKKILSDANRADRSRQFQIDECKIRILDFNKLKFKEVDL